VPAGQDGRRDRSPDRRAAIGDTDPRGTTPRSAARGQPDGWWREPAPRAYPPRRPPTPQPPLFRGRLPGAFAIGIVAGAVAIGALITALAGLGPGPLLGAFLIAGTLAAGTVVRADAAHLIIPAPAPAYAIASILTGLHSDPAAAASHTALALGAVQWIAGGFPAMAIATVLAIAITIAKRRRPHPRPSRPAQP